MKRKNIFKFALLGATALTLVACGEAEEDILAYNSVEACVKGGQQDEAVCRAEFAKAQKLHNEVAPRYGNSRDCIPTSDITGAISTVPPAAARSGCPL